MEMLTERKKEMLAYLNKNYPFSVRRVDLIAKFIRMTSKPRTVENGRLVLEDITLLKEMRLIEKKDLHGEAHLKITSKGKEKLRENFKTRLIDTAYNNPWGVIAIVIGIIALVK